MEAEVTPDISYYFCDNGIVSTREKIKIKHKANI
jgi:hypothetical protein